MLTINTVGVVSNTMTSLWRHTQENNQLKHSIRHISETKDRVNTKLSPFDAGVHHNTSLAYGRRHFWLPQCFADNLPQCNC